MPTYSPAVEPIDYQRDPRYRDYGYGSTPTGHYSRKAFGRLRRAGAFDPENPLYNRNPFTEAGQADLAENPLHQFTGPVRRKPTIPNVTSAISGIFDKEKPLQADAYGRMFKSWQNNQPTMDAQGEAVRRALASDVVSPEMLAQWQAAARERIGRELGTQSARLSGELGAQGQVVNPLNPAYAAAQGNALYQMGQAEVEQATNAAITNRSGLMDALGAANEFGAGQSRNLQDLLNIEQFRSQFSKDEIDFLMTMAGLRKAG